MAEVVITKENFENEVLNCDIPVLVDFWASWCGPCKMIAPIIEEIAKEYEGTVKVGKVNVDDEQELAIKFGIASIPTLLVFRGGEITDKLVGYRPKEDIEALIG